MILGKTIALFSFKGKKGNLVSQKLVRSTMNILENDREQCFFNSGSSRTGIFVTCFFFYKLVVNPSMLDFVLDSGKQRRHNRTTGNERDHARTRGHASDRKKHLQERANEIQLLPRTLLKLTCYYSNTHSLYSKRVRVFENKTLTTVSNP